jgi:type II secretory pathway component PulK
MRRDTGIALVKVLLLTLILFAVAAYAARGTRVEVRVAQNDYLVKRASRDLTGKATELSGWHEVFR